MAEEMFVTEFDVIAWAFVIKAGGRTSEAEIEYFSCRRCGVILRYDDEVRQLHADWHGEIESIKRGLATHRQSGGHIVGPLA